MVYIADWAYTDTLQPRRKSHEDSLKLSKALESSSAAAGPQKERTLHASLITPRSGCAARHPQRDNSVIGIPYNSEAAHRQQPVGSARTKAKRNPTRLKSHQVKRVVNFRTHREASHITWPLTAG
ncbi:uncharacterized protein LOC144147424 [Haemaphysalis longicornis]